MSTFNPNFPRRPEQPPRLHPRKVRGGVKIQDSSEGTPPWSTSWAAQRWVRLIESIADGSNLVEGLQYAKLGQTRSMSIETGVVSALVQGRSDRAYAVKLVVPTFTVEQWHRVVQSMSEGAVYAAKLLAGELPATIEDLFMPLGLRLFPSEPADVTHSCGCRRTWAGTPVASAPGEGGESEGVSVTALGAPRWCKHACCAAYLFAERLASDPFLMFRVRGLAGSELMDQLRHARATTTKGAGLYVGRVPGVSEAEAPALDQSIERFWEAGPELATLETTLGPPPVTHPLLRRLGPSPFVNSSFPLVGLLASCYDTISADTLRRVNPDPVSEPAAPEVTGDDDE